MSEIAPCEHVQIAANVSARWPYFPLDPEGYKRHMQDYYYFMIEDYERPFGYMHKTFARQMPWPGFWRLDHDNRRVEMTSGKSFEDRTRLMEQTLRTGIETKQVEGLRKWNNELFPVYGFGGEHILNMDGSGLDLFGVVNFAVHMIAYVMTKDGVRYWVPRRSKSKMSYPGMLDNTVGGGLAAGEIPLECIVREAEEEVCFEPEYTRSNVKACGTASYQMCRTDSGLPGCQHQVQYLYEMEVDKRTVPKIGDGEVEELALLSLDEVRSALANGEFKLNCAITWVSFLVRHGHITAENESHLQEICARMNRRLDIFIV